ncbi:hypothetical protein [Pseudomonas sp. RGM2987]|uniref:hypothetical protein n=1 Tax=Pseudomonas sp. RGM2987 TaxID=2930090 RepID=UPI001FD63FDA|nr:hypothetical protein [Pseudomonas sp. RGM2987]MCJ8207513.1 hypothetical protein [Pseudomonas sp. RGM2987]
MTSNTHKKIIDLKLEIGESGPIYYEVFARENSRKPLTHIGSIDAPNLNLAKARAWFVFDHQPWLEMVLVPNNVITPVLNNEHYLHVKGV